MAANIEFKARLHDVLQQEMAAIELAGTQPELLIQRDTFFNVSHGRMKLREISGASPQLIQYFREDKAEVRRSDYILVPIEDPAMFVEAMDRSQGIRGVVRKLRKLWLVDQTRIHFDHVDGLGDYVELEVVLQDEQSDEDGLAIAKSMMERLMIREDDIVECAYIDLLEKSPKASDPLTTEVG